MITAATKRILSKKQVDRVNNLLPDGIPKYVRCYDNGGKSFDRYTVVFTGSYTNKTAGQYWYVGMSKDPFHPQGFGQMGYSPVQIDRPTYSHIGKPIKFKDLTERCQKLVYQRYLYLWDFKDDDGKWIRRKS